MLSSKSFKVYLFSYQHNGARWDIQIPAVSPEDAKVRLSKIAVAKFDGELVASVPVPRTLFDWFRRIFS